jgi:hypothetical protein
MTSRPSRDSISVCCGSAFLVVLAACAHSPAATPNTTTVPGPAAPDMRTGEQVVAAMHDRYVSTWYKTLTFVQQTTNWRPPGGTSTTKTWWEAGLMPGRLRIDTDSISKGDGVLFRNDSVYSFAGGKQVGATPGVNDLMVLGFDVYSQPVSRSLAVLKNRGFDLTKVHDGTWRGEPVWIVGATAGDTTSKQFWVSRDRLIFLRLLQLATTPNGSRYVDLRFDKYVKHGGGWVAEEVWQYIDGKPALHEDYSQVRVDVPLDEGIFDPARWSTAQHWAK